MHAKLPKGLNRIFDFEMFDPNPPKSVNKSRYAPSRNREDVHNMKHNKDHMRDLTLTNFNQMNVAINPHHSQFENEPESKATKIMGFYAT